MQRQPIGLIEAIVVVGLLSLTFLVWAAGLFAVYVVLFAPGMD